MTSVAPAHLVLLVGICALWGFNLIAIKAGVDRLPPVFLTLLRFAIVAVLLVPWLRIARGSMAWLLLAALCSGGLQFALMYAGIARSGSMSAVAIVGQLGVPFTTLLSILLLGERVRWRRWTGIGLSFAGVMLLGFNPAVLESLWGLSLVVLAALVGAFGLVAVKRVENVGALELQAWFAWTSLPVLLGLTLWLEDGQWSSLLAIDAIGIAAVVYTAVAASLVAHTLFYWLVQRYPVTSVAPITVLAPVFSVMFAVWLLGDRLDWRILAGGAMTLTGVAIIALRERKLPGSGT
ncbi:MAG: DMT family transporter [Steroidobacteraceae bacterium]|jgi:O-acetylserine/cysteine efflux transporter|nr:DMT family transporter [Steroidobacteraceae bacterium]